MIFSRPDQKDGNMNNMRYCSEGDIEMIKDFNTKLF